jgi:hypothetical protein
MTVTIRTFQELKGLEHLGASRLRRAVPVRDLLEKALSEAVGLDYGFPMARLLDPHGRRLGGPLTKSELLAMSK